eukprot:TRINITY_DN17004_c0_g1_i1.p4 TRINITY_DN17004_c0_g1~~TRINITY_DN17004_c0_g1_i1.p4  ORF type:complete len:113 (+),score=9.83 TRINITY_DN17004_c0_g1_i1:66-404(+)
MRLLPCGPARGSGRAAHGQRRRLRSPDPRYDNAWGFSHESRDGTRRFTRVGEGQFWERTWLQRSGRYFWKIGLAAFAVFYCFSAAQDRGGARAAGDMSGRKTAPGYRAPPGT